MASADIDDAPARTTPSEASDRPGRRRRWWRPLGMAVMMLLLFAAGYSTRVLAQVWSTPGDASAEAGFARDMSAHHAQAVEMALVAWQRASQPETRTMAYATATAQQAQIGMMQTWLSQWHLSPAGSAAPMAWIPGGPRMLDLDGRLPGMASTAELAQLETAQGKQVDVLFCQLMIRHHLGGVHMIDAVLAQSHRSEVLDLAGNMKASQQADVTTMQRMLTDLVANP
jgi:uncharacterized protein (DUF305 family)